MIEFPAKPQGDIPSFRIGMITPDFESHYFGLIIESAAKSLRARGHETVVQSSGGNRTGEINAWHSLMQCGCDGVILRADRLNDQDLDHLMTLYPNSILMKRSHARFSKRCICLDNYSGGEQAARHLIANGHRRVAMVTGPLTRNEIIDRRQGFIDALRENDNETILALEIETDFNGECGAESISQVIAHEEQITAVFFHNDDIAVSAMDWCRRHGIQVPQDISIIGFDNARISKYTTPRLTTIQQPISAIGEAAVAQLMSLLSGAELPQHEITQRLFSPQLIERSSVSRLLLDSTEKVNDIVPVSKREKTCLYWAAKGKTSWEISIILEVSESTVVFHLRNVGHKLKTANRTHTVAEAIRLGIIAI